MDHMLRLNMCDFDGVRRAPDFLGQVNVDLPTLLNTNPEVKATEQTWYATCVVLSGPIVVTKQSVAMGGSSQTSLCNTQHSRLIALPMATLPSSSAVQSQVMQRNTASVNFMLAYASLTIAWHFKGHSIEPSSFLQCRVCCILTVLSLCRSTGSGCKTVQMCKSLPGTRPKATCALASSSSTMLRLASWR